MVSVFGIFILALYDGYCINKQIIYTLHTFSQFPLTILTFILTVQYIEGLWCFSPEDDSITIHVTMCCPNLACVWYNGQRGHYMQLNAQNMNFYYFEIFSSLKFNAIPDSF